MNGLRIKVKWTKVGLKKSGRHFEKVANLTFSSKNFRDMKKILKLVTMEQGMGMGNLLSAT